MAGGKQTPRQRMIGILYLVLLGLIALDVPESLLDAFKNIRDSLTASTTNVQAGVDQSLSIFKATKLVQQHDRALPIYNKALHAQQIADSLNQYIETIKKAMIDETGGFDDLTNDYKGREDLDVSVHMMINDQKYAETLKKKIEDTKAGLLGLLDPKDTVGMDLSLETAAPRHATGFPDKTWAEANFGEGVPMGAAITSLVKIQADTKNAENLVIKKILGKMDEAEVNLDEFQAVAVAPTSYVIAGQPYTAQVFLTASDSKSNPNITVNGNKLQVQGGKGLYTASTGGEGMQTWEGKITVKRNNRPDTTYSTGPIKYQVARPSAVVSPEKMNVLYIGLPNPLAVSAPGVPLNQLHLTMSNGSVSSTSQPGHFIGTVSAIGTTTVGVTGTVGGKSVFLGNSLFRIKRIPDPKAEFAGKSGGTTSAANVRGQDYIFARLEGFEFDAKFSITHFTVLIIKPRQEAIVISGSGGTLTGAMHQAMSTVTPGSTIVFKDIVAVGPDNAPRSLDPIVISTN
jgi:gliding motility-associated protein GldM